METIQHFISCGINSTAFHFSLSEIVQHFICRCGIYYSSLILHVGNSSTFHFSLWEILQHLFLAVINITGFHFSMLQIYSTAFSRCWKDCRISFLTVENIAVHFSLLEIIKHFISRWRIRGK